MHPLRERACDDLLEHPLLRTPPPEPEKPKPPRVYHPRVFKLPPRFPLIPLEVYNTWCNHRKELYLSRHKVDDHPPGLFPELYLKPRRLNYYAKQLEANMNVNKELLKRINIIQRTGGFVDCWINPEPTNTNNKLLCQRRQRFLNELLAKNIYFYSRLCSARSEQPITKELNAMWKDTKHKLILGASPEQLTVKYMIQPSTNLQVSIVPILMLNYTTSLHPKMSSDAATSVIMVKLHLRVAMMIWVRGGSKIGRAIIELFVDLAPQTCALFLNLVRGADGRGYCGTRIFRVVPGLYCCCGDVVKDNGFGCYVDDGEAEPMTPEHFNLNHSVPGVLSMAVNSGYICGQFNIIFKPLPQFDGKHVVFGRVIGGPVQILERISAMGLPRGSTTADCEIQSCGWFTRTGVYREGAPNSVKFHTNRH